MEQNIIFYFSGTGNSLKTAKDIAKQLTNCRIVSMGKPFTLKGVYARIGFVFPSYAAGLPQAVESFIGKLDLSENRRAYCFSIVTCGAMAGNCLPRVDSILKSKGLVLNYGSPLKMFANYVGLSDMAKDPDKKAADAEEALAPIIREIVNKQPNRVPSSNPIIGVYRNIFASGFKNKDRGFRISDKCAGCGQCAKLCPVGNIKMSGSKPEYKHGCQQCMACIQFCPNRAIDYKKKTQKRGRYHHPAITAEEMITQAR